MKTCKDVNGVRINLEGFLHITPEILETIKKPPKYKTIAKIIHNMEHRAKMFGYASEVEKFKASVLKKSITEAEYDAEELIKYNEAMASWEKNNKKVNVYTLQFPDYKYTLDQDPFEEEI